MDNQVLKRAELAFKKDERATQATAAWNEYQAIQAAVDANMMRLRALRLAREASTSAVRKQKAKVA